MNTKRKKNLRKNRKKIRSKKQNGGSLNDVKSTIFPPKQGRTKEQQTTYFEAIKAEISKLNQKRNIPKIYVLNRDHIYPQGIFVFEKPATKEKPQTLKSVSLLGKNTKKKQLDKNLVEVNLLLNRKVSFVINKKYLTQIESFPKNTHGYNSDFIIDNSNYNTNDLFIELNTNKKITVNNTNSLEYIKTYLALKDNRYFMTTTINEMPANESGYSQLNNKIHKVYANGKADGILRKNDLILQSGGAAANKLPSVNCSNEYNNFKTQFETLIEKYNKDINVTAENKILLDDNITQIKIDDVRQKLVGYYKPKNNYSFTIDNNNIFENRNDYSDFSEFKNTIDPSINIEIDFKESSIVINNISTEDLINVLIRIFYIQDTYCINNDKKSLISDNL